MCGEKLTVFVDQPVQRGSPPRVRGEVDPAVGELHGGRITPACAGRRGEWWPAEPDVGDHPRVCGEKETKLKLK